MAKAAKRKRKSKRKPAADAAAATVRFYCQGIGDCHLLRLPREDGGDFWMLIDCGIHTSVADGPATMARIVDDIAATTKRIDVLVVTHEHWDHVSAFHTAREAFQRLEIGEVWMPWTENPADPQAQALDTYKQQALAALQGVSRRLNAADAPGERLAAIGKGLDSLLGFEFGIKGERVRAARDAAAHLVPDSRRRYLEPKGPSMVPENLKGVRIYVLGPPRDAKLLGIRERSGELYHVGSSSGWPMAYALGSALALADPDGEDRCAPFDPNIGTSLARALAGAAPINKEERECFDFVGKYYAPAPRPQRGKAKHAKAEDASWRRIDLDWLSAGADLALQLDSRTNNCSLALAFEFVESRKVMLFAADAQVGNWLSWHDLSWKVEGATVTAADLLARTVLYKVAHHGSHNATLRQKGLELMTSPELVAFLPTNEEDAKSVGWGEMPLKSLYDELNARTSGRTIRADDAWIGTNMVGAGFAVPSGAIRGLRHKQDLYVEMDVG